MATVKRGGRSGNACGTPARSSWRRVQQVATDASAGAVLADDQLLDFISQDTDVGRLVRTKIEEDGYLVLPNVITREECAHELERLWRFVEATAPGVRRDDPDSWFPPASVTGTPDAERLDPWPHSGWKFLPDMCQSFQGTRPHHPI